jgi:hypothetical protein
LLWAAANVPAAIQGIGIDGDDAVPVSEFVEVSETGHLGRILVSPMQQDHDRVVLLRIIALRQVHDESARMVVDFDFFLGVVLLRGLRLWGRLWRGLS